MLVTFFYLRMRNSNLSSPLFSEKHKCVKEMTSPVPSKWTSTGLFATVREQE
jgi:hypothetical protein